MSSCARWRAATEKGALGMEACGRRAGLADRITVVKARRESMAKSAVSTELQDPKERLPVVILSHS